MGIDLYYNSERVTAECKLHAMQAVAINWTLKAVGVYLTTPVFSHGQLYVATCECIEHCHSARFGWVVIVYWRCAQAIGAGGVPAGIYTKSVVDRQRSAD